MSFERRLLAGAVIAWLVVAVLSIVAGPTLAHDEAAFAVAARGGASWLYRSAGTIELARLGVVLGGADWAFRIGNAVLGVGVVLATWAVARAASGERVAAWSAAVIATCTPMTLHSAELMGDLPSLACTLAGIALLVGELSRDDGPRWRVVAAAPAFAAAFYLRYGNAPVIAIAGVAAAAFWWRGLARRPLPVIAAVVAFAALLAPHVVASLHETGRALGILEWSAAVPRRAYVAEGLVEYALWVPMFWYGALVTPVVVIGLVAPVRRRPAIYLAVVGAAEIVALGLDSHARPRYIFVALALLVIVGVERLMRVIESRRRIALGVVALGWLANAVAVVPFMIHLDRTRVPRMQASATVKADARGEPCTVIARAVTQLMWYAGCDGILLRDVAALPPLPARGKTYIVSVPHELADADAIAAQLHASAAGVDPHVWLLHPL